MKCRLSFSLFHLLLLVLRSSGLACGKEGYPLNDVKCCSECPPGTKMKARCTENGDTACLPCEEGSYKEQFGSWPCEPCTTCEPDKGLQEVKRCERNVNTICVCLPGYQPVASESPEKRCDPCPSGYFSKGGKKACTPWTNCTANGRKTFQAGTTEDDAVCDRPAKVPQTTELSTTHSSERRLVRATSATKSTLTSSPLTALTTEGRPRWVRQPEYLWFILITAALLLVSGGIIRHTILKKNKKNKGLGLLKGQLQKNGENSFRIPIQEEQIDTKASLVQN